MDGEMWVVGRAECKCWMKDGGRGVDDSEPCCGEDGEEEIVDRRTLVLIPNLSICSSVRLSFSLRGLDDLREMNGGLVGLLDSRRRRR